ncbi:LamG-like jellyroll fold domain-containing protein [Conexibacter woesei]|uniref:LamG domain protein jellyroll fold domain protein n=1 Tax=Conexibacter woesei (strain DSM 14684 / CCUG 47730 / CIP 108061 / JCM 11494 / NBRC 100937 / ID131577) TaxID=469383 RepID=D3F200_CONWI|nr:LamG-like jellyroll fold domain-containing protein [Conexibacter woesei]ADB50175.1 LamG domain protein jellyroll fold domain protein [Conexibacter woesei DSM 14684]
MPIRRFDGVDDFVTLSIGAAGVTRAVTLAFLLRSRAQAPGVDRALGGAHDASGIPLGFHAEVIGSNGVGFVAGEWATATYGGGGFAAADEWRLLVLTKAAGSVAATFHSYDFAARVLHTSVHGVVGDAAATTGGTYTLGMLYPPGPGDCWGGELAAHAVWASELDAAAVRSLATAPSLTSWLEIGRPAALWLLDQPTPAAPIRDLTGNGADQVAIVGTTVLDEDPPIPYRPTYVSEVTADAPAAWIRLGETRGTSAADAVGGTSGTYVGSCTLGVPGLVRGDADRAVRLDGAGHVSFADRPAFDLTTRGTIEAWVRVDTADAAFRPIVDKGEGSYIVRFDDTGRLIFRRNSVQDICKAVVPLRQGVTTHVVVTWDASAPFVRIYFDGVDVSGPASWSPLQATSTPLTIGADDAGSHWVGALDEVAIYPTALSRARVQAHHAAGIARRQHATAYSSPAVTSLAVSLARTAAASALLVSAISVNKSAGSVPRPSTGWTLIAGDDGMASGFGQVALAMAYRIADGTSADVCGWTWTTADNAAGWIAEYAVGELGDVEHAATWSTTERVRALTVGPVMAQEGALAVAHLAVDTWYNWDPPDDGVYASWSDSFAAADRAFVPEDVGGAFADRVVHAAGPVSTTVTSLGGEGDQSAGILVVFGAGTPPTPAVLTQWCGGVTSAAAEVVYTVDRGAIGRLALSTTPDLSSAFYSEPETVDAQRVLRLPVSGLSADTSYYYGVEVDGTLLLTGRGTFRTMATEPASFRVAFGSCAHPSFGVSPTHRRIVASGAQVMIQSGDLGYPDEIGPMTVAGLRASYDTVGSTTGIDAVMRAMPVVHVWDDHDSTGEAGGTATAAAQVYREREPHYALADPVAIHQTWTCGRVRFVVLDCRSQRDPLADPDDDQKSALGAAQRVWLDGVMRTATEPVIVVISSVPWNDPRRLDGDAWGRYSTERAALIASWRAAGVLDRILMVSGDAHMLAADDGTNSPGGIPAVQAAPLGHHSGSRKGGTFSEGTHLGSAQYGLLTVTDNGGETISVTFDGRGADDATVIEMTTVYAVSRDPDGGGQPRPVEPRPPPMGSCGAELYAAVGPLAYEDHLQDWALAHLCEAIGRMRQSVSDIVRDSERTELVDGEEVVVELPGWSLATDVDWAPGAASEIDMLPFVGQLAGVRGIERLSDDDRRAAIRGREGFWRGGPRAILSYAESFTDGTPGAVRLRERYDPNQPSGTDAPYHGRVIVKRSRLKPGVDEAELRLRLLGRIPAGLIYDVLITDELDYDDVASTYVDYDEVAARTTDYTDLLEG